jgi:RNA recognition motif-containing protein
MNKKLYVGNLLYEATDDQLRDHFSQAGTVVTAQVIRFADSGRSKGFGFVEMGTEEEAQKAIEMFHDQDFQGRKIIVNEARPKTEGGRNRFGQGGNRRFGGGGDRGRFDRGNDRRQGDDMNQGGMGGEDISSDDIGMPQE